MSDHDALEESAYQRALYRKSPAYRLKAINRARRRQGYPERDSLNDCRLIV